MNTVTLAATGATCFHVTLPALLGLLQRVFAAPDTPAPFS
jgi:hypothetical protein